MSHGGWAVFSLIGTVSGATYMLINQYIKQPGHMLVFMLRLIIVILMTPFMFSLPWPTSPVFYIVVTLTALFASLADVRLLNVIAKYGAGVTARTLPLVIFLSFLLWFVFDPNLLVEYITHPLNTLGIIASLLGVIYFSARLKKCEITKAAFIAMIPTMLGYTANTALNKFSMQMGAYSGVVFGYMYIQSIASVFLIGGYALYREKKSPSINLCKKRLFLGSSALALLWMMGMTLQNYSMIFIPNPAYQIAIGQLSPILIAIFYYFIKHKETADVRSGMGVVACAILLVLIAV